MIGAKAGGSMDPGRTLALLWRDRTAPASQRGPRPGLTVDAVVTAAIDLADAEGIAAVTMRRVAELLRVAPMSLYTYVPGKAELLELMLDTVYSGMPRADTTGQPWRARLTAVAAENRTLYERHPWATTTNPSRPPLGPGLMTKYEHELAAFDDLGLDDIIRDAALTFLLGFVQAAARAEAEAKAIQRDTAMTDEHWWAANAPVLTKAFDESRFPLAVRVGAAAGAAQRGAFNPTQAYEFGLHRVLDGLAVLIGQ
jgi:AcrR family transcriptional regulator